ncbi:MAG: hypothetical protein LBP35_00395 [Candidatus Ancillula trichonymphae]|nr:hypothetical protein [Candidatus Ancillula trichonymphae]
MIYHLRFWKLPSRIYRSIHLLLARGRRTLERLKALDEQYTAAETILRGVSLAN